MGTLTTYVVSRQWAVLCLAVLAVGGCSGSTQPNDPYAGTYDAVVWTWSVRNSEPVSYLSVEGASYTLSLHSDGQALQHLIVPGGLDGGLYDRTLPGTWTPHAPDSLVVVLNIVTEVGDTVPAYTLPFSVRGDTIRTRSDETHDTHEEVVLVRRSTGRS
jgi:hypothetical protein